MVCCRSCGYVGCRNLSRRSHGLYDDTSLSGRYHLKTSEVINSMYLAWNTLSLVHVMEFPTEGKEPGSRMMFIDSGTAATGISDLSPDVCAVLAEHADEVGKPSMIAYVGNAHPKILIIGSSAGEQVLDVLKARASSIASSTPTGFLSRARNGDVGSYSGVLGESSA